MICSCGHPRTLHEYPDTPEEAGGLAGCAHDGCECVGYGDATSDECFAILGEAFGNLERFAADRWIAWGATKGRACATTPAAALRELTAKVLEANNGR